MNKKIKLNRQNGIIIGGKVFISLLKALQITSKVLKEKINYDINVTLDELLDDIASSGRDPNYEITKNGKGTGEEAIDMIPF